MVKILIADDEKFIRKGLSAIIQEMGGDFSLIGEASDGLDAWERIQRDKPDIVITDVKMPKMDGIELSEAIRKKYPNIKIIVLSGFDDFEFVRGFMKNGALDYLLKPIDESQLVALLKKVNTDIVDEYENRMTELYLKRKLAENKTLLADQFVKGMVFHFNRSFEDYAEAARNYHDIILSRGPYQIIIVSIDNLRYFSKNTSEEFSRLNLFIIRNIAEESVAKYTDFLSFQDDAGLVIACRLYGDRFAIRDIADEIFANLSKYSEIRFTAAIGSYAESLETLKGSYDDAIKTMLRRFYQNKSAALGFGESIKWGALSPDGLAEQLESHLNNYLEIRQYDGVAKVFHDFYDQMKNLNLFPEETIRLLTDVYGKIRVRNAKFRQSAKDIYGAEYSYETTIRLFDTLDEAVNYTCGVYVDVLRKVSFSSGKNDSGIIENVKSYVIANYSSDINLSQAAKAANVNPTYLSELFKSQTGEGFIDYVTRLRIEKAKELLRDGSIKTYQAGEMVGYKEPSYFSRVFKKIAGVTPNDYRKLI